MPAENGLLAAEQIRQAMESHFAEDGPEHMVQPGMVYISFSSEVGTIYSLAQLKAISSVCREYGLPLFIDGARMGYGLESEGCDVTLTDIAALADVFYRWLVDGSDVLLPSVSQYHLLGGIVGVHPILANHNLIASLDYSFFNVSFHNYAPINGELVALELNVLFTLSQSPQTPSLFMQGI